MLANLFRAGTLGSNSHFSISLSLLRFPGQYACPWGSKASVVFLLRGESEMGQVGAGRTVWTEHVIKSWPWSSDPCWPRRPWSLASWCFLVPEHSYPGILTAPRLGLSMLLHFQAARHPEKRALYLKDKSNEPHVSLFRGKAETGESRFMQRRRLALNW